MRKRIVPVASLVAAAGLIFGLTQTGRADVARYKAKVFVDRSQPTWFIPVDDFRVNETISDTGGVRYLMVRGPEGVFQVPFRDIAEVQFIRLRGYMHQDIAMYDSRVIGRQPELNRTGVIWLRVMLGVSNGQSWYMLPRTTVDKGARLMRIVFGEGTGQEMAAQPLGETARPVEPQLPLPRTQGELAPPGGAAPGAAGAALLSLEELNKNNPLLDVFFEFDKSTLTPAGKATLERDAGWLKQNPTTKVVVEGYADPRGTNEYNLGLGERRADAARQFLLGLGVAADRIGAVTKGKTQIFCPDPNEMCWAQNRRAHFVFVAR